MKTLADGLEEIEAKRALIESRKGQEVGEATDPAEGEAEAVDARPNGLELLRASDIVPEAVAWLWPGWLAAGKLHILGGAPGTGKTTLALALASVVSRGGFWPDRSRCEEAGNVLIWSGEDSPSDTLVPRLRAVRADCDKVFFLGDILVGKDARCFDPSKDMGHLEARLEALGGARLLIVDPIVSAVTGDSHKNTEVRRALQPFVDLAARYGCAVLGITHVSKGMGGRDPTERIAGSIAFGAVARLVMVAAKNQDPEPGEPSRSLVRSKANLGEDSGGFGYDLVQEALPDYPDIIASRVEWGAPLEGSALQILDKAESPKAEGKGCMATEAVDWLRSLLTYGPMLRPEVLTKAKEEGFTDKPLRTACDRLGIVYTRKGRREKMVSWWGLPGSQVPDD